MSLNSGASETVDVLVVGAGAGGMTAALSAHALGLETVLIEKSGVFGGSTALSGGGVWIPNHPVLVRQGIRDDPATIVQYLTTITEGKVAIERLERYVEEAPKMAELLEAQSRWLKDGFVYTPGYPDYFPERGGNPDGRGLWTRPIDLRELGDELGRLRIPNYLRGGPLPRGAWLRSEDLHALIRIGWRGQRRHAIAAMGRIGMRIARFRLLGERMAASGNALAARLRLALQDGGVPVRLETPLISLVTDESGRVVGATIERNGEQQTIRTRRGVVLATGGFDHNMAMRREHQPGIDEEWSFGSPDNLGEGIRIGRDLGGAVDLMDDAWWMPAMKLSDGELFMLLPERQYPGQFVVNAAGERFVNESTPYTEFVHAQLEGHRSDVSHIPAWMITDDRAFRRNVIAGHLPRRGIPDAWKGAYHTADTLAALAAKIGVPADALEATAARFNGFARLGRDEDFHRGDSVYDNYYGDPSYPNPNLGEVSQAPYYAFALVPSDLGTKGGLVTDADARVLREDGTPIPGLFATGNVSSSVMGHSYAGPGATLGPAMTFGYVAARVLADSPANATS